MIFVVLVYGCIVDVNININFFVVRKHYDLGSHPVFLALLGFLLARVARWRDVAQFRFAKTLPRILYRGNPTKHEGFLKK